MISVSTAFLADHIVKEMRNPHLFSTAGRAKGGANGPLDKTGTNAATITQNKMDFALPPRP